MSEDLLHKIEQLNERCPIEFPDQLYLRKGGEYIQSYEPVFSMRVDEGTLFIEGHNHATYEHNTKEFDSINLEKNVFDYEIVFNGTLKELGERVMDKEVETDDDELVDLYKALERIEADE